MKKWFRLGLGITLFTGLAPWHVPDGRVVHAAAATEASVVDIFGREVNGYGIELVDWQGYLANPYVKLTLKPPASAAYPVTITLNAQGSSRLMMDMPSTLSATGATKTITFNNASEQKNFLLEIAPDRIGNAGSIENYALSIRTQENNGTTRTQAVPIRVLDQDDNLTTGFPLKFDYRFDTVNHIFDDPAIKTAAETAIKDWFYFLEVKPFDTVPAGDETSIVPNDNFNGNTTVSNNEPFNGEWIFLRGLNGPYSTGWSSNNGKYHKINGQTAPGNLHRSLGTALDFYDDATVFTSIHDDDWYKTDLSQVTDVYGLIMHEFGHGIAYNDAWPGMVNYVAAGGTNDAEVIAYQGYAVPLDGSYHIPGDQPYWDRISGQSGGWSSLFPVRRWMLSKLSLLVAENAGWKLNKNLSPFVKPAITTTSLKGASAGQSYNQKLTATGGVPFYDWTIASGALPPGLALNRFTGAISGTVAAAAQSSYTFTVRLRDYDEASAPVTKSFTINTSNNAAANIAVEAVASTSYVSPWESLSGLNDQYVPASSNDRGHPVYGNWNNPGTTQWVQYDFNRTVNLTGTSVYWFDDNEGIDLPESYTVQYWSNGGWVNVANPTGLGVLGNQFNETAFTPVTTTKIRLNVKAKPGFSSGIEQWKVYGY
ncbi:Ig domain-containing protein [Paenibacillus methanolicus]|uniref:F5/8 type C domain-containing protein n=1 Tax=Paenibacillus methanolicus TaxID=582686 RepID=A0A5S5CJ37_9BACL|nr:Ig domain-containing protein [Paenibacillus methanolicus]TYP78927.1 F5/8 type C domain-containing protein [Paenibacillus methanolicus]